MNNDLKERLPFHTKISLLIALVIFILAALLIPEIEPKPYKPRVGTAVRTIELPPQMRQLKEPPPPPKPKMPVAAETESEVEAATIERTDFTGFEKQPPKLDVGKVYEFWAVEVKPELVGYVEPEYPDLARRAEIEGTVTIEVVVDTTGRVASAKIAKSLHQLCDDAALKAARQWRFSPAKQRDRPVQVRVHVPVRFTLEK